MRNKEREKAMTWTFLSAMPGPWAATPVDLLIRDGRFTPRGSDRPACEIDAAGQIALPGLIEAHTHLDKTLIGMDWFEGASTRRAITGSSPTARPSANSASTRAGNRRGRSCEHFPGVLRIRSHVDVDAEPA